MHAYRFVNYVNNGCCFVISCGQVKLQIMDSIACTVQPHRVFSRAYRPCPDV